MPQAFGLMAGYPGPQEAPREDAIPTLMRVLVGNGAIFQLVQRQVLSDQVFQQIPCERG